MARNGSGTYSLPAGNPVVTGTTISSTWANTTFSDIGTAITGSVAADGQTPITANLPMSGFKLTGLAAGSVAGDSVRYEQFASPPAIGGTAPAAGNFTTLGATGVITSTLATGTAPFTVASTTEVANLKAATATLATTANALNNTASNKLWAGTCTQAAGALTLVMPACIYDFRSTTLTSGAVTQISGTPADLVVPSGATLGSVTTVSARIVRLLINNAGTMEQAVVNISGGNDLSETGTINTTAIDTASDSANVFYSTTARTGVAYRVVGIVDAVNTAGAWGNPTLVQGAGGEALRALHNDTVLGISVASTSGTSIDFTGIPSWVKRITFIINSVSTSGTSRIRFQLGSGSIETSGYTGVLTTVTDTGVGGETCATAGFDLRNTFDATSYVNGTVVFNLNSSNIWACSANVGIRNTASTTQAFIGGSKTTAGALDRIRLTTVGGTDTFDAGTVNIMYE